MTPLGELLDDLTAEHRALRAILAQLTDAQWDLPTPSPGWLVRDQAAHLAHFDEKAALAIVDADAFRVDVAAALAGDRHGDYEARYLARGRAMAPAALLAWWRESSENLAAAARGLGATARLPWYGPDMSVRSFLAARLMETWSHGLDVVDVVRLPRPDTDRPRHVVSLGLRTRGFSYVNRGLPADEAPVYVQLTAPSGATWTTARRRQPTGSRVAPAISAVW
jgi:uncharacterized protein (TIGR03084 family)